MKPSYFSHPLLRALGLDEKETAIYGAALELGQCSQVELAETTGIKRTTLREYIPTLITRGVLQQTVRGKRTEYVARDPRELLAELKDQVDLVQETLPTLLAQQKTTHAKPTVRYFEGLEGLKQVYTLSNTIGQPLVSFLRIDTIDPELRRWVEREYLPARHRKKIPTKNIVNSNTLVSEFTPDNELRQNRLISTKQYPFNMEVFVFADYVAYMHYQEGEELYAVLIQSHVAADTMRSIHTALWDSLDKEKTASI